MKVTFEVDSDDDIDKAILILQVIKAQVSYQGATNLSEPIDCLRLTVRTKTCLNELNIHTLEDLIRKSAHELTSNANFGKKSLFEVEQELSKIGLLLRPG